MTSAKKSSPANESVVKRALKSRIDPLTGIFLDGPGPRWPINDPEDLRRHMAMLDEMNAWWRDARRNFPELVAAADWMHYGKEKSRD